MSLNKQGILNNKTFPLILFWSATFENMLKPHETHTGHTLWCRAGRWPRPCCISPEGSRGFRQSGKAPDRTGRPRSCGGRSSLLLAHSVLKHSSNLWWENEMQWKRLMIKTNNPIDLLTLRQGHLKSVFVWLSCGDEIIYALESLLLYLMKEVVSGIDMPDWSLTSLDPE